MRDKGCCDADYRRQQHQQFGSYAAVTRRLRPIMAAGPAAANLRDPADDGIHAGHHIVSVGRHAMAAGRGDGLAPGVIAKKRGDCRSQLAGIAEEDGFLAGSEQAGGVLAVFAEEQRAACRNSRSSGAYKCRD